MSFVVLDSSDGEGFEECLGVTDAEGDDDLAQGIDEEDAVSVSVVPGDVGVPDEVLGGL